MKKYLLLLVALFSLSLYSCTDKAANTNENNAETTEATVDEALAPTGDVEKDAQAVVDRMAKVIEETDFTNEEHQKKLEEEMKTLQETFDTYYKDKGEEVYKAWEEAGKKATEKINLEDLMQKKVMEAIDAAANKAKEDAAKAVDAATDAATK